MPYTTYLDNLHESDTNYPKYKLGRVILENGVPKLQVCGPLNDILNVTSFNVVLPPLFNRDYNYGRVHVHKQAGRVKITLCKPGTYKNMFLSRYVYQTANNTIISDGSHIDHIDGNKTNDILENLSPIHHIHNTQKSKYANNWLLQYNLENNTKYLEKDLANKSVLTNVIDFAAPYQKEKRRASRRNSYHKNPEEYKQRNIEYTKNNYEKVQQMYKNHYRKNKDRIRVYNREYREANKANIAKQRKEGYGAVSDVIKEKTNKYYHDNKESIREKRKLYRKNNHEKLQARKTLYQRLDILSKKEWTKEVGERCIDTINQIFNYYNVTLDDIKNGLDVYKYNAMAITSLNKLRLLYSFHYNKLHD